MNIQLEVVETKNNAYCYFNIMYNKSLHNTSKGIARLLNIGIEEYNERLITKVIDDKKYEINDNDSKNPLAMRDINFIIKYLSPNDKQIYIERFENEFVKELTLLKIGGEERCLR